MVHIIEQDDNVSTCMLNVRWYIQHCVLPVYSILQNRTHQSKCNVYQFNFQIINWNIKNNLIIEELLNHKHINYVVKKLYNKTVNGLK